MSSGFKGIKIGSHLMGKQRVGWVVHRMAGATSTHSGFCARKKKTHFLAGGSQILSSYGQMPLAMVLGMESKKIRGERA